MERGLTAPTIAGQAGLVAAEVRAQFVGRGKALLAGGSRVRISPATFHVVSAQIATLDATVSGPAPGRWQLVLVREGGQWLLIDSKRLP